MTAARRLVFLIPGDLDTPTGGYRYDRHIVQGLRAARWTVEVLRLEGGFPFPDEAAQAAAAGRIAALPDGTMVVADGLAFGALPQVVAAHARRLRWVALVHHPLSLETGLSAAARQGLFDSERRALASARCVIVTSPATAHTLAGFGVAAPDIRVVLPGTAPAALARGTNGDEPSLLCVATVTPRKGHAVLVEALAGLTSLRWTLHCVGSLDRDRACAGALRDAIAAHGLEARVHLHGELDEAALPPFYAAADAFVLPSHYEGYGMVLTEALARGLPVVSTTAGAIPDTVPPAAGVLVPPGDAVALRAVLRRLVEDRPWRRRLAEGARHARRQLPTWPDAVVQFAAAVESQILEPA